MKFPGFVGGTYVAYSSNLNNERCVNLYPEVDESGHGKGKAMLVGTPGYILHATLPHGPVRGIWAGDGVLYAVGGDTLYSVSLAGAVTSRGVINSPATPARIVSNGAQLLVCSGGNVYLDNGAGVSLVLSDGYVSIAFLDGYFIALRNPTTTNGETKDKICISALFDGSTWSALDTGIRQGNSDRAVQIIAHKQQLWIFAQESSECWYNSGAASFPFSRIDGSGQNVGAWPWTIAELEDSLFYVGSNARGGNSVYRTRGFTSERVSNHAIESAILAVLPGDGYTPQAYTYTEAGHSFYVLSVSSGTFVFDTKTSMWHERGIWNSGTSSFDVHDGGCQAHLFASAQNYIGSRSTGNIWNQSLTKYTYNGTTIRRNRRTPYISDELKNIFFSRLQVDMEMGTQTSGTPTGVLKWSNDGGKTFNTGQTISLAAAGVYSQRAQFRRLGKGRNRVFDFTLPDYSQGPVAITDAYLDLAEGVA